MGWVASSGVCGADNDPRNINISPVICMRLIKCEECQTHALPEVATMLSFYSILGSGRGKKNEQKRIPEWFFIPMEHF